MKHYKMLLIFVVFFALLLSFYHLMFNTQAYGDSRSPDRLDGLKTEDDKRYVFASTTEIDSLLYKWEKITFSEIFTRAGINAKIQYFPTFRAQKYLELKKVDAETTRIYEYGIGREDLIRLDVPLITANFVFYSKQTLSVDNFEKLSDLNITIAVLRGRLVNEIGIERYLPKEQIIEVNTSLQGLEMVSSGRVDAFFDILTKSDSLIKENISKFKGIEKTGIIKLPLYCYLRKDNAHLKEPLEKAIKQLHQENFFERFHEITSAKEIVITFGHVHENSDMFKRATRLIDEISRRTGIDFVLRELPMRRSLVYFDEALIDAELSRVAEFNELFPDAIRVTEPISLAYIYAYSSRDDIVINGFDNLASYSVVSVRGYVINERFKDAEKLYLVNTTEEALHMLNSGRVDIFIGWPMVVDSILDEQRQIRWGINKLEPPIDQIETYTFFRAEHKAIAQKYEKALKELKDEGIYDKIIVRGELY